VSSSGSIETIEQALKELHGDELVAWLKPAQETIDECGGLFVGTRVYRAERPSPHWHYVSFGLSDLQGIEGVDESVSEESRTSGYGFELSCRVPWVFQKQGLFRRAVPPVAAPTWPSALFEHLARYIFSKQSFFEAGHHFDLQGPLDGQGRLTAVVFADDPLLAPRLARNGSVKWLQIVGLDADELRALQSWDAKSFTSLMAEKDPLLQTDVSRKSMLSDEAVASRIRDGIEQDGSSFAVTLGGALRWRPAAGLTVEILLDDRAARELRDGVARRLHRGRAFICVADSGAPGTALVVTSAESNRWLIDSNGALVIQLRPDFVEPFLGAIAASGITVIPGLRDLRFVIGS
jgi:hypothetical protein